MWGYCGVTESQPASTIIRVCNEHPQTSQANSDFMAYLTLVAAVPEDGVAAIRADERTVLEPTMVKGVSHLLAYWIQAQPLGELLARVIDGGEVLSDTFWHPLRPPLLHHATEIASLTDELVSAWTTMHDVPKHVDEWLGFEMTRLLAVMKHARDSGAALITALELPADSERAQRVRIPWEPYSPEHGVSRRRWWLPWTR